MTEAEVVSLKEYFERRLEALDKASCLAAKTLEKRLDGMNEFREALKDQSAMSVTRAEMNVIRGALEKDIGSLKDSRAEAKGKASQATVNVNLALTLLALGLAALSLLR